MKRHFSFACLTALCFLLFLLAFFLPSVKPFLRETYYALRNGGDPGMVEENYNEYLPFKEQLVTLNGGVQKLLGKREVNNRYLLDNGHMTYVIPELDMENIASVTQSFSEEVQRRGIPFLYVNLLFKIDEQNKQLPAGVEDYSNENADRFVASLRERGVDCLDLRELEKAQGLDHYSLFFPTDHHWTPETGLWASGEIAAALRERDPSFAYDPALFELENYNCETCKKVFLGSHGRRVGVWYAGLDDLDILTPRFETRLRFSVPSRNLVREGSFEETMLFPERLTDRDLIRSNRYVVYCGDAYDHLRIENLLGGNGKRLLVLEDSFSHVVIPFFSLAYGQVDYLDLRAWFEDPLTYIDEVQPDAVLILYNPGALEDNNTIMFDFFR